MSRALGTAVAVLGACLSVSMADAASIGINFYKDTQTLTPDVVAGATGVAQSNWNNMTISNADGNGYGNTGTLSSVNDSAGAAVTGLSITAGGLNPYKAYPVANTATWGFSGGNLALIGGQLQASPTVVITGIPYANYDIYCYTGPNGGTAKTGSAALVANSAGTVDSNTYYWSFAWQSGNWVTSTSTTSGTYQGNLVLFANNTASNVTIQWDRPSTNWGGLSAIQIVAVPEPTSLGLLGLGSLALLVRRRAAR